MDALSLCRHSGGKKGKKNDKALRAAKQKMAKIDRIGLYREDG